MEEKVRFEILLEQIAKDVRTVAEGHISLDQKIDRNHKESKGLNRKTNVKLDIIGQTLAGKIDQNREKIEQVDQKVEINRKAIDLNRKKIEEVGQKVEINREAIEGNREAIEGNRKAIDINRQELVRNRGKIEEVNDKLSTNLENHEERIRVLEVIK